MPIWVADAPDVDMDPARDSRKFGQHFVKYLGVVLPLVVTWIRRPDPTNHAHIHDICGYHFVIGKQRHSPLACITAI